MAPPPADSDARRVSMAPQERRGSTASRSDSNPTARRDPGARRPSDAGTLRRGSLGGPPPPPKRSAENDRILELKQIADRAAGKRDEDEEVEAGFRAALLEIVFYLLFVVIFAMVTWLSSIQVAYPYSSKITGIVVGDPPYSLRDVYKEDQFWGYLEDTLVPGIFVSRDYNHQQLPESRLGYVLNVILARALARARARNLARARARALALCLGPSPSPSPSLSLSPSPSPSPSHTPPLAPALALALA